MSETSTKRYTLTDAQGNEYQSETKGQFGGTRNGNLYGLMSCRSANQAIARGGYVEKRVFFADEETAIAAGFRPCHTCMPEKYAAWKATQKN